MSDFEEWDEGDFEDAELPRFTSDKKGHRKIDYGFGGRKPPYLQGLGERNPGGSTAIAWCWDEEGWSHGLVWLTKTGRVRWDGGKKSSYMGTNEEFKSQYNASDTDISNLTEVLGLFGQWCMENEYNIEVANNMDEVITAGFERSSTPKPSALEEENARLKAELEEANKKIAAAPKTRGRK